MTSYAGRQQPYRDRRHAGVELAARLGHFRERNDVVVLALPRGGVPVAYEVARALDAPLDVFLVRKLGTPGHRELAMGAIASGGVRVLNDDVVAWHRIPDSAIDAVAREEQAELERRERAYRNGQRPVELRDHVVLLIDDGLATGSTMKAAVQAVRAHGPSRIVVAVPVGSSETCREFADIADEIVCARAPEHFAAVGQWYQDFSQTTDGEVRTLLQSASERCHRRREGFASAAGRLIEADLAVPDPAREPAQSVRSREDPLALRSWDRRRNWGEKCFNAFGSTTSSM